VSFAQRQMQRYFYSYELYKRVYLTLRWRLRADFGDLRRLEHQTSEAALLVQGVGSAELPEQRLTDVETFTDDEVLAFDCGGIVPDPAGADGFRALVADPGSDRAAWLGAVRGFQRLHRDNVHSVAFFVNMAPEPCLSEDRFFDAGSLAFNDAVVEVLSGDGVPVASSVRAFLRHRPSEMPLAGGHSAGNANRVKADVLFDLLESRVLDELLPPASREP
jgi:hypothetical protein